MYEVARTVHSPLISFLILSLIVLRTSHFITSYIVHSSVVPLRPCNQNDLNTEHYAFKSNRLTTLSYAIRGPIFDRAHEMQTRGSEYHQSQYGQSCTLRFICTG